MEQHRLKENQPWVTCYLTDILRSYIKENQKTKDVIDYPALFRGIEGFETPSNPELYLTDVNNWVPLAVLRELEAQCEKISGRKDIAYHAAKNYFVPGKVHLSSLFEIIVQVLNDVRSVLVFSNLWGSAQTNYLKLQSFEKPAAVPELYVLAQFHGKGTPSVGAINLCRGFCEGFPRLYSFISETHCTEEISQLHIENIVSEFPDFTVTNEGDRLSVRHRASQDVSIEAISVHLKAEVVPISHEFMQTIPGTEVVRPQQGQIEVLTHHVDTETQRKPNTPSAYQITNPGVVSHGSLAYRFQKGQIYGAPYSRFRFAWKETERSSHEVPVETIRRDVSQLLFDHLKQIKQTQMRIVQYNIEKRNLTLENLRLRQQIEREYSFAGIVGESRKMQDLFSLVRSATETDVTVIIQGETGTGKELVTKAIHYNSPRRAKRIVALNCGALSETLLESELFGHEKGAFTGAIAQRKGIFEVADGGTLFLDEIGETTPSTQVKLLRVLQEGEFQRVGSTESIKVDVRIIAATNQNLEELVKSGRLRQDLYYRLNVFPMVVPPLRERAEDIPLLVTHFIEKHKQRMNKPISEISPEAMALLMAHSWPGNVRELENVVQRMMVVCKGESLDVQDLPIEIQGKESELRDKAKDLKGISRGSAEVVEKRAILDALSKTGGNVTKAAKSLGISRATLHNKMKHYHLRDKE